MEWIGDAALTSLGFFWKAGWAFAMGYLISAMIQTFVPKQRLVKYLGKPTPKALTLSAIFGAASSSCSFAALAAARALMQKGAHFIVAVAFMFASTNLVIELGVLILIFLGWQYLVAEVIGGLLLIVICSLLMRVWFPSKAVQRLRKKLDEEQADDERIPAFFSKQAWIQVSHAFKHDWQMVWKEVLIGFTMAGIIAVAVPAEFWNTLFLTNQPQIPEAWVILENALVAPFVAAATFIGSMGNIPLATVLAGNGVLFAGIMGFIYSDLMVPPLVAVNAKYYGWKLALYIAFMMWVSIVISTLLLHVGFAAFDILPQAATATLDVAPKERFAIDYTFYLNIVFAVVTIVLLTLANIKQGHHHHHGGDSIITVKNAVTLLASIFVIGGVVIWW